MFSKFSPLVRASEPPRDAPGVSRRAAGFDAKVQRDVAFGKDRSAAALEVVEESKLIVLGGWYSCVCGTRPGSSMGHVVALYDLSDTLW